MTYQVKEGDVLEYRGDGIRVSYFTFLKGKKYKVQRNHCSLFIADEEGDQAMGILGYLEEFGFHLVTTPPTTIQHEGYNYTRGEPVVPEWVKDGAWVVNKESGDLHQLFEDGPGYFKAVNKKTRHPFVLDFHPSMPVSDVFRPFTNEDWKWGMWAEYQGEKVFVCSGKLPFDLIRIDANPDGKVHTTLGSNGYVNIDQITPTTAP